LLSLEIVKAIISNHALCVAMPEHLSFDPSPIQAVRLPCEYFSSVNAYGALMVSKDFYKLFGGFDYILIYQLDCFVFADQVAQFCALGCDYIAPLILGRSDGFWPSSDIVGVGGFSLRKVSPFIRVLELIEQPSFSAEASSLASRIERNGAEDMFWSLAAPVIAPGFSVASPETALAFGFEGDPRKSYFRARRQKPFGCHHWNKLSFFLWYLPWIPLPLSQRLRLIPPVLVELTLAEVVHLWSRIWGRARRIFYWAINGSKA
jgi:hypothetical protein